MWPKHLPYPISWLRAIALLESIAFYTQLGEPFATTPEAETRLIILVWAIQLFAMAGCRYFIGLSIYFLAKWWPQSLPGYHSLQDRVKRIKVGSFWFLSWDEWREGINALIVSFLSTICTTIVTALFLGFISGPAELELLLQEVNYLNLESQSYMVIGIWLTFALALYEYDRSVRDRRLAKRTKLTLAKPSSIIDPVEQELNQLKAEMGVTRMKSVKNSESRGIKN